MGESRASVSALGATFDAVGCAAERGVVWANQEQAFPLSVLLLMLLGVRLSVCIFSCFAWCLVMLYVHMRQLEWFSLIRANNRIIGALQHALPRVFANAQQAHSVQPRRARERRAPCGALEKGNHFTFRCAHARFAVHARHCETCFIPS